MFQSPSGLTLGTYSNDVINTIDEKGGKLGFLDFIAGNPEIFNELKGAGILVYQNLNPIIVGNNQYLDNDEYQRVIKQNQKLVSIRNGYDNLSDGELLVRVSAPGDFRSLVDIFPTEIVEDLTIDGINGVIAEIKKEIHRIKPNIIRYAEGTGVEYGEEGLSYGVVTKLNVPIVTVTEDPNTTDIFIDDYRGENYFGKTIYTDTDQELSQTIRGKKVRKSLDILRKKGILDKGIAYQLELGELYDGKLVMFQIKEFAKKNPLVTSMKGLFGTYVNRIISGNNQLDYSLPINYGGNQTEGFLKCCEPGFGNDLCLALGYNANKLQSNHYSPNISGFIHGDAHGGAFNHNSFRMAQAVVQKGGIAILCNRFADAEKILGLNNTLSQLDVHFNDGKLKASIISPNRSFADLGDLPHPESI